MSVHERINSTLARMEGELRRMAKSDRDQDKRRDLEFRANTLREAVELLDSKYAPEAPCPQCKENHSFGVEALVKLSNFKMEAQTEIQRLKNIINSKPYTLAETLARPAAGPDMPRWLEIYNTGDAMSRRTLWVFASAVARDYGLTAIDVFSSHGYGPETDARHLTMALMDKYECKKPLTLFRLMVSKSKNGLNRYMYSVIRARFPDQWKVLSDDVKGVIGHDLKKFTLTDLETMEAVYGTEGTQA
jgi:hypothetical protein